MRSGRSERRPRAGGGVRWATEGVGVLQEVDAVEDDVPAAELEGVSLGWGHGPTTLPVHFNSHRAISSPWRSV